MACVASACLHLVVISQVPKGVHRQPTVASTAVPTPPPLIVTVLPSPTRMAAPAPASVPKPRSPPLPAPPPKQPATTQRASPLSPKPAAPPTHESQPLEAPRLPKAAAPAPAPEKSPSQPLNLTLPPHATTSNTAFGTSTGHAGAHSLRQRIQSRIETERMQNRATAATAGTGATHITERVNPDGSRQARVDSSLGSYCLSRPRHHVAGDPRMPSNTVVPTTCP